MTNIELLTNIRNIITTLSIDLSDNNKKFLSLIEKPDTFYESHPGAYGVPSEHNNGETSWQRKLFREESDVWRDLELPIGQKRKSGKTINAARVDLIGFKNGRYIICELKHEKDEADQPFDAILQLIAYFVLIKKNYMLLDESYVHRKDCIKERGEWTWEDVAKDPIILLRCNNKFWSNWSESTPKNKAAREIVEFCRTNNIDIRLYCNEQEISICG